MIALHALLAFLFWCVFGFGLAVLGGMAVVILATRHITPVVPGAKKARLGGLGVLLLLAAVMMPGAADAQSIISSSGVCPNPRGFSINPGSTLCWRMDTATLYVYDGTTWQQFVTISASGVVTIPNLTVTGLTANTGVVAGAAGVLQSVTAVSNGVLISGAPPTFSATPTVTGLTITGINSSRVVATDGVTTLTTVVPVTNGVLVSGPPPIFSATPTLTGLTLTGNLAAATGSTVVAGTGTGAATLVGVLSAQTGSVGCTAGGVDATLFTFTLPANSLSANGKGVRISTHGTGVNNANAKLVQLFFGATAVESQALTSAQANRWAADAIVLRTGATAQQARGTFLQGGVVQLDDVVQTTPAETLSGAVVIKVTGNCTAANDILGNAMIVEFLN